MVAILGIVVNIPLISLISLYKGPILLFKGWHQLIRDLIGREGPFLETVCVPFAGLWILLWPLVVLFAIIFGILSSIPIGLYSAVVAYQESSTKRGLNFVVVAASVFDEYTNDLLYLREGSCFPRPQYRERADSAASLLPVLRLRQQMEFFYADEPLINSSANVQKLSVAVIWDEIFNACESIGKELLNIGAIHSDDIDGWKKSKNKIVNIWIPAYAFLDCFLRLLRKILLDFSYEIMLK